MDGWCGTTLAPLLIMWFYLFPLVGVAVIVLGALGISIPLGALPLVGEISISSGQLIFTGMFMVIAPSLTIIRNIRASK